MQPETLDIAIKVAAAWGAGSLIGLERTFRGRPAGFRTHALVCTASALLMLVTSYQWQWIGAAPQETIRTDPTRMAQGIMTGIGFLGGGVIFKEGLTVRGLTTAASIWATSALGILYGIGMYYPALLGTAIVLGILAVFRRLEDWFPTQSYAHLGVSFVKEQAPPTDLLRRRLKGHGFKVSSFSYVAPAGGTLLEYRTVIHTTRRANMDRLVADLREDPGVAAFQIAPAGD